MLTLAQQLDPISARFLY